MPTLEADPSRMCAAPPEAVVKQQRSSVFGLKISHLKSFALHFYSISSSRLYFAVNAPLSGCFGRENMIGCFVMTQFAVYKEQLPGCPLLNPGRQSCVRACVLLSSLGTHSIKIKKNTKKSSKYLKKNNNTKKSFLSLLFVTSQ